MDTLRTPEALTALGTVVLGVLLYGLAPFLPSAFPRWFTRMVGFWVASLGLCTLWLITMAWQIISLVGFFTLAIMAILHLRQERQTAKAEREETDAELESTVEPANEAEIAEVPAASDSSDSSLN